MPAAPSRRIWKRLLPGLQGPYHKRTWIMILWITSVPILILAGILYTIGIQQVRKETERSHQLQIRQASQRISDDILQMQMMVGQWSFNPLFDDKLRTVDFTDQFRLFEDISRSLVIMESSNALIRKVSLYLDEQRYLLSVEKGLQTLQEQDEVNRYRSLLQELRSIYWKQDKDSLALIQKIPLATESPFGTFILEINSEELGKQVGRWNSDPYGAAFILNADGQWLVPEEESENTPLRERLRQEVLERGKDAGSFTLKWKGENYVVSNEVFPKMGWRFVSATSISEVMKPVRLVSWLMIAVSSSGLLAAVFLAWFASVRINRPVVLIENQLRLLTTERNALQTQLHKELPALQKSFFLQLVQGHLQEFNEEDLRDRLHDFGWMVKNDRFSVIIVHLSGLGGSSRKFTSADKQLVTFAAANIVQELGAECFRQVETMNLQDMTCGLVVAFPQRTPPEDIKTELFRFGDKLLASLTELLGIKVAVCLSRVAGRLTELPDIWEETCQLARYRNLEVTQQLIDAEDVYVQGKAEVHYPFEEEKDLLRSLRKGEEEETRVSLDRFMEELSKHSRHAAMLQEGVLLLLGSIHHVILQSGFQPLPAGDISVLYAQSDALREADQYKSFIHNQVLKPYFDQWRERHELQQKQMVGQMLDIIQLDYHRQDLSLDSFADVFGTYPARLSQIFKQATGMTFIDYLTQYRLTQAKELLTQTDLRINDIADKVGYQPSYFIRLFKKYTGVTPGQFRDSPEEP